MTKKSVLPYVWMLCGSLAFALMGTMAHALRSRCDWQVIAMARSFFPLLFVAIWATVGGARLVLFRPGILWVRSIAGSVSMVGTFFALTRLPVSDVFTLINMFPIWVAVLSWPMLGEQPSTGVWLSVGSGVLGVMLIQQPHLAEGNIATWVALAGSISTAIAMLGLHRLRGIDARAIVVHFSGVALVFCVSSYFVFERSAASFTLPGGQTLFLLLGVGVAATIGQLFLTRAFAAGPPAKVSVVGLTQIVFAMGLEVLLFDHRFQPVTLVGMVLVMAPTAWLLLQRVRRPRASPERLPAGELPPQPETSS